MRTFPFGSRSAGARLVRPWRSLVLALTAVAALVPMAATAPASAAGRPAGKLVPASGFYVGAYSKHADGYGQDREQQATSDLEARLGRRLHIDHHYYSWTDVFPSWREPWDIQNDRIPMISWNGENTDAINRGDWDGLISSRAQAIAMLNTPVFIRWFWEMDGNKKAAFAGTPDQYIAAWRHIVTTFRNQGADNVRWVWCPNASAFNDGAAQAFYPGDDFVDWTCADGYNWAPGRAGDDYRSFRDIFAGFYGWAALQKKPIMVGEFGVQERNPGDKAQWITDARGAIKSDFPRLKAVVYFNSNKDYDWSLTTSDSALEAFKQMANDPWFNLGVNRRLPQ